ncbi:MAG: hypothetical protein IK108_06250 [Clostridia bacterium]|nr:hypothetical protein [Clostridia bacterium]
MYKLRRSRPVKIVCFLLGCLFLGLFVLNVAAGIYALTSDRLDFYSDTFSDDLREDAFAGLAAHKAAELRSRGVVYYAVDGEKDDFFSANRGMKQGGTNFAFSVTDENGRVLLGNFTPESVLGSYITQTRVAMYTDGDAEYKVYDDDTATDIYEWEQTAASPSMNTALTETAPTATDTSATAAPTESAASETESTTVAPEPTAEPATDGMTAPAAENTTEPAEGPTSAAAADPTAESTSARTEGRVNTDPVNRATEDVYIQDDTAQGYKSIMMYIYPIDDGIDEDILNHCIELYHKSYEPREAQYYRSGAYEVYHQTDFAVSSNGSAYFIGVEREEYTTTAAPPRREPIDVKYYTLTVSVDGALQTKDIAWYTNRALGFATWYLTHFIALTAAFGLAALFFAVCSLILAGYVKNEEAPVARGIHRFPTDLLFIVFFTLAALFAVILFDDLVYRGGSYDFQDRLLPMLLMPCLALGLFACVYVFTVKLKSHTAVSSVLLVRLVRWCAGLAKEASSAMNVLWKLGAVYVIGGILGLIALALFHSSSEMLVVLYLLFKLAELAFLVLLGVNLNTLQNGAKDLSEGKRVTVKHRWLFGEFKKHAGYLNSIGDGINAAVEQRLKSENTKTELITNVSHDLKTPLTSIVNYIDLLKKEPVNNPRAQEYIEVIDRQSQRLKKLTSDIVDASKAAAGSVQMDLEPTDLNVLLGQVKGEYEEKLTKAGLTPVFAAPQENVTVTADGRLLWRVFDNLLSNVCKYAQPDTRVYLTLTNENGKAKVVFRNISAEPLNISAADLTDRFVRGDASRNTEGSGLGLYIAKSLCEAMGGGMTVKIDGDLFKVTVTFPTEQIGI